MPKQITFNRVVIFGSTSISGDPYQQLYDDYQLEAEEDLNPLDAELGETYLALHRYFSTP